jgi:hypothetical protein
MTKTEIELFATDAVRSQKARPGEAKSCYFVALQDISESGFRITKRVKDTVWAKLESMEAGQ